MNRLGIVALLVVTGLLALPAAGTASIVSGNSLDWLCECRRHVAIVRIPFPAGRERPSEGRGFSKVPGRVVSVLKGTPPREVVIDCWNGVRVAPGKAQDVLAFFDDSLRVDYAIALDDPESCVDGHAVTQDARVLRSRREILAAVSARLSRIKREGRAAPGTPGEAADRQRYLVLDLPETTAAFHVLMSGSAVFLFVPADSQYRVRSLRDLDSPDPGRRAIGAASLARFPGPSTVARLRALLDDRAADTLVTFSSSGARHAEPFRPVACAACQSLRAMGLELDCDAPCPSGTTWSPRFRRSRYFDPSRR